MTDSKEKQPVDVVSTLEIIYAKVSRILQNDCSEKLR